MLQSLAWINRRCASLALLALLLVFCFSMHFFAMAKIEVLKSSSLAFEPRMIRNMAGIEFIHDHWWFVLPYLILFAGSLFWLAIRNAPRWSVWITFLFFSLPSFGYVLACLRAGTFFTNIMGPAHGL